MAHRAAAPCVAAIVVYPERALGERHRDRAWHEFGVVCACGVAINRLIRRSFDFWWSKSEANAEQSVEGFVCENYGGRNAISTEEACSARGG